MRNVASYKEKYIFILEDEKNRIWFDRGNFLLNKASNM